ncbi:hypothetical protein HID58_033004, partial [Brassica napus]
SGAVSLGTPEKRGGRVDVRFPRSGVVVEVSIWRQIWIPEVDQSPSSASSTFRSRHERFSVSPGGGVAVFLCVSWCSPQVCYGFSVAVRVRGGESSALSTTASSFGGGTFRACLSQG